MINFQSERSSHTWEGDVDVTPIYPTMWQMYPAQEFEDMLDYLLSLTLTPEQLRRGLAYLEIELIRICVIDQCDEEQYIRSMCKYHYGQWSYSKRKARRQNKRAA